MVPTPLRAALYRLLGDDLYALLRVPRYLRQVRRAARGLRRGGALPYERRELSFVRSILPSAALVVDVGAFMGDWAVPIALAAPGATVVALEPMPSTCRALRLIARLSGARNLEIHNLGAAAGDEQREIGVQLVRGVPVAIAASLHQEPLPTPGARGVRRFSVKLRPVDAVLAGRRPDLVKIDVEGFEEPALQGMTEALRARPRVICELWHGEGPHRQRRDRVVAWMAERGYAAHLLDAGGLPVPASEAVLRAHQEAFPLYENYVFLPG